MFLIFFLLLVFAFLVVFFLRKPSKARLKPAGVMSHTTAFGCTAPAQAAALGVSVVLLQGQLKDTQQAWITSSKSLPMRQNPLMSITSIIVSIKDKHSWISKATMGCLRFLTFILRFMKLIKSQTAVITELILCLISSFYG